jgi:hypothetical protein
MMTAIKLFITTLRSLDPVTIHLLEKCSQCPAEVRSDRMQRHLAKVHKLGIGIQAPAGPAKQISAPRRKKKRKGIKRIKMGVSGWGYQKQPELTEQQKQELFERSMDSGGRFGSSRRH